MHKTRSQCPLTNALDIIGDKWALMIVRDIFFGKTSFKQFLSSPESISTSVLTSRLQLLKQNAILSYKTDPKDKKIKHYYLTASGVDLYDIIFHIMQWSNKNLDLKYTPIVKTIFRESRQIPHENFIKKQKKTYLKSIKKRISLD